MDRPLCDAFRDVSDLPIGRLHGDAHLEQYAFTEDAWGLADFDDTARGPEFIDIVRFLGSIDLATRRRGWTQDRDALWDRFFAGYRAGLGNPAYRPPESGIVRMLRGQAQRNRAAFLSWGETEMQPMQEATSKSVVEGMAAFERFIRRERPDLRNGYFAVRQAGWLRTGVGSTATRKVLIPCRAPRLMMKTTNSWKQKRSPTSTGSLASPNPRQHRHYASSTERDNSVA